jgi:hypothetical protein
VAMTDMTDMTDDGTDAREIVGVFGGKSPFWIGKSTLNGLFDGKPVNGWNRWDVILPIDELHHFSRWLKHVKTTNQEIMSYRYQKEIMIKKTPLETPL